jgi:hypothetical protein
MRATKHFIIELINFHESMLSWAIKSEDQTAWLIHKNNLNTLKTILEIIKLEELANEMMDKTK